VTYFFKLEKVGNEGRSVMIHRNTCRSGLRNLHMAAIMSFLAAIGVSNRGWAFVVASPPQGDDVKVVAEQSISASIANQTAVKTLHVFCRAANLPHIPLPAEPLPAEQALNAADANSALDVIGRLSETQSPLCLQNGSVPNSALEVIDSMADVDPISHHPHLPAIVAPEIVNQVRDVYGQVKARGMQQQ
jgi:hypothetical protein